MSAWQTYLLQEEIRKMLKYQVIEIGESDYASPMILVETPGKDPRPCIDYRKLNEVIRTQFYPLPNIEHIIETVAAAKYITLLDLTKGYWQIPLNSKGSEVRAFLGIAGYYRQYIPMFSSLAAPLTELLKGKSKKGYISWTSECQKSFVLLKEKLSTNPVLYAPDFKRQFILQTDASDTGIGIVLAQRNDRGEEHPILYLSKKFSDAEREEKVLSRGRRSCGECSEEVGEKGLLESRSPTFRIDSSEKDMRRTGFEGSEESQMI
ncbi:retrovirus-related Pol polyprotein from transposon 17.6 [Trichonephila clavipes]|nr:retrovirus-related Pol polyprotein from transposon 17.6 [Trichonephila clavipes]